MRKAAYIDEIPVDLFPVEDIFSLIADWMPKKG